MQVTGAEFGGVITPEFEVTEAMVDHAMNRRTDDPMHNTKVLREAIIDSEQRTFSPEAVSYVVMQALSEVAESDVHALGTPIKLIWDDDKNDYASFMGGATENARKGFAALNKQDDKIDHEFLRREQEIIEAQRNRKKERRVALAAGQIAMFASPTGTHREIDPDIAQTLGYDGRTMLRFETGTQDVKEKTTYSFSIFDVPIEAWAAMYSKRLGRDIEPLAIEVMKAANEDDLYDNADDIPGMLRYVLTELKPHLDERETSSVEDQFDGFINKQEELLKNVQLYVHDRVEFEKDLALSGEFAVHSVERAIHALRSSASKERKAIIDASETESGKFKMSDNLALAIWQLKVVSNFNRAGIALDNKQTIQRVTHTAGEEFVNYLREYEHETQRLFDMGGEFDLNTRVDSADEFVSGADLSCGGGCTVQIMNEVNDPVGSLKAHKLGLKGTLYASSEMNKKSSCCASPNVRADGKNKCCLNCGKTTAMKQEEDEDKSSMFDRAKGNNKDNNGEDELKAIDTRQAQHLYTEMMRERFGGEVESKDSNPNVQLDQ